MLSTYTCRSVTMCMQFIRLWWTDTDHQCCLLTILLTLLT